jgi:hypothetical protein
MEIRITGQPGAVQHFGNTIVFALENRVTPSEDWPEMPERAVPYVVFVSARQWRQAALDQNAQAAVDVSGYCFFDAETKCLIVLARKIAVSTRRR